MPVFHTKTIESILDPVANQVNVELLLDIRGDTFREPFAKVEAQVKFHPDFQRSKNNFLKNDSYSFREKRRLRRRVFVVVATREDFFLSLIFSYKKNISLHEREITNSQTHSQRQLSYGIMKNSQLGENENILGLKS